MKMGNRFLLGSAAALVAVGGAQAADLPVKAQPTQFVKICSLYGAGFYYVPGTDMCLKIGGWVRAEYAYGDNGNFAWGWANGNVNNRTTNNSTWRARGYITADARNQTEYGTVRGYLAVGLSTNNTGADNAGNTFSAVGRLHVRAVAIVLRFLQLPVDLLLGFVPRVGYERWRLTKSI